MKVTKTGRLFFPCPTHHVEWQEVGFGGCFFLEEAQKLHNLFVTPEDTSLSKQSTNSEIIQTSASTYFFQDHFPENTTVTPVPEPRWGC